MNNLHYVFNVKELSNDLLVVKSFEGKETISDAILNQQACNGFRYDIQLASRHSDLLPEQFVDKSAELIIYFNGEVSQRVNGIIRQLTQQDIGHHHTFYSVTLVPELERLSLRHNSRIFQQKNAEQIITLLLNEMGVFNVQFLHSRPLSNREFCVQYRESDLAFIKRLAAEEGLIFNFEHQEGAHYLTFSDRSEQLPKLNHPITYNSTSGGMNQEGYISQLEYRTQSAESEVTLKDYSFKKPQYSFLQTQTGSDIAYQRQDYAYFDSPGRYKDDANGKAFSQIRLNFLRRESHIASGLSNQPLIRAGHRFTLQGHLTDEMNQDWLIVSTIHKGEQPQALEEYGTQGATTYQNEFEMIPASKTWQAAPQPKPKVDGPMIATVVGPENEEIFCDEHGRVKIHFPWDRYSNGDEHSSCWVRVAQGWAGNQYGMMALPRIGHEVIVEFLNGDPDQPIVKGRAYNAINKTPYSLPEHKTKTVLRTKTYKGDGFNELSFEDQVDQEQIYLHAQKDYAEVIQNDHSTHIKHDKHLTTDNDAYTHIKNDSHVTVEGENRSRVSLDRTEEIGGSLHIKVANLSVYEANNEIHIKAGHKLVIEAGGELSAKAGGSFVKVDAAGVHLVGPMINLNSGGSAGSGSGFIKNVAQLPNGVAVPNTPPETLLAPIEASMTTLLPTIATLDFSLTELCQKRADGSCNKPNCQCEKQ